MSTSPAEVSAALSPPTSTNRDPGQRPRRPDRAAAPAASTGAGRRAGPRSPGRGGAAARRVWRRAGGARLERRCSSRHRSRRRAEPGRAGRKAEAANCCHPEAGRVKTAAIGVVSGRRIPASLANSPDHPAVRMSLRILISSVARRRAPSCPCVLAVVAVLGCWLARLRSAAPPDARPVTRTASSPGCRRRPCTAARLRTERLRRTAAGDLSAAVRARPGARLRPQQPVQHRLGDQPAHAEGDRARSRPARCPST